MPLRTTSSQRAGALRRDDSARTPADVAAEKELARLLGLGRRRAAGRARLVRCGDDVTVGPSPTAQQVEVLALRAGFRSILNLNVEGEEDELLSPNVEATWAHTFGLQHLRAGVDPHLLGRDCADRFLEALAEARRPVYVHSRGGERAAALMALFFAARAAASGGERDAADGGRSTAGADAISEARQRGLDCPPGPLERFVLEEVARRTGPLPPGG